MTDIKPNKSSISINLLGLRIQLNLPSSTKPQINEFKKHIQSLDLSGNKETKTKIILGETKNKMKQNINGTDEHLYKKEKGQDLYSKNEYLTQDQFKSVQNWLQNQPKDFISEQEPVLEELKLAHERRNITVKNITPSNQISFPEVASSTEIENIYTNIEHFLQNKPEYSSGCTCCDITYQENSYENSLNNSDYTNGTYV